MNKYKISTSDGRRRDQTEYETQEDAAEALRMTMGWDKIVLSGRYTVGTGSDDLEQDAVSAYATQEECDADQEGAHAPRITRIVKKQQDLEEGLASARRGEIRPMADYSKYADEPDD